MWWLVGLGWTQKRRQQKERRVPLPVYFLYFGEERPQIYKRRIYFTHREFNFTTGLWKPQFQVKFVLFQSGIVSNCLSAFFPSVLSIFIIFFLMLFVYCLVFCMLKLQKILLSIYAIQELFYIIFIIIFIIISRKVCSWTEPKVPCQ
jgi:hypothetical protein